jgi:3-oxoacyl-(acyl-carrier-protein) synthase III
LEEISLLGGIALGILMGIKHTPQTLEREAASMTASEIRSTIAGVGAFLPGHRVSSDEIAQRVQATTGFVLPPGYIERMTGIRERRHAADEQQPSDLASEAGRRAVVDAGLTVHDVDTLIFASASHDLIEPAVANLVQQKLGMARVPAFDVKNACNSLLTATDLADGLIRAGKAERVLIVAGETPSRFVDYRIRNADDLKVLFSGLTLGDGGGAILLRKADDPQYGIHYTRFHSFGEHWDLAVVLGGGAFRPHDPDAMYFRCHARDLFDVAVSKVVPEISEAVATLGWSAEEVNLVVPHQVSDQIVRQIAAGLGAEANRCALSLAYLGNTVAASVPITLDQARQEGRLKKGDKVLLVGGSSGFSSGVIGLVWSY